MSATTDAARDDGSELGGRAGAAIAVSVLLVVTAWLFWPLVHGALRGSPRFFEWDVAEQYWPDLVYVCRSLHHGALPAWNPYDRGGYPFFADPQAASYHPLVWGICAAAGPSPALGWQTLRVALGFLCAGLFALPWLRRLGASWGAAALGAVVVECAPFMRHNFELNLTATLGWLPMVLWALERVLQRRTLADAALLSLAAALLVWAGSPPAAWLAAGFTTLYGLGRLAEVARAEGRAAATRIVLALVVALLVTAGLTAVVLVPGLELAHHTVQAGRSYASLSEGGLEVSQLRALVAPLDGNHLYVGWVALALAPLSFLRRPKLPGASALAVAAVLAVLLALGDHGPLYRAAFELVPGVRLFRLPHRYEAWLGPSLGALAAGGLDAARARVAAAPARVVAACALGALGLPWLCGAPPLTCAVFALAVALVVGSARLRLRGRATLVAALLALASVLDVSQRLPPDRHTRPLPAPGDATTVARILPRAPRTDVSYRYMDEFGIGCRSGTRLAHRDFRGYQDPLMLASYERVVDSLAEHPALAAQFNVRYALTSRHFLHGWDHHYLPRPEVLARLPGAALRGDGVIELGDAMPLAYFVPASEVAHVASRQDALARLVRVAPAPVALVEDGRVSGASRGPGAVVAARVETFSPDALRLTVHASTAGVLVVNEVWYPGWRAWVDGRETPVRRANGLVRAVAMPAGARAVELRFEPAGLRAVRLVWLASWAAVAMLAATALPRTRKRRAT